jgi:hypothetical protein
VAVPVPRGGAARAGDAAGRGGAAGVDAGVRARRSPHALRRPSEGPLRDSCGAGRTPRAVRRRASGRSGPCGDPWARRALPVR